MDQLPRQYPKKQAQGARRANFGSAMQCWWGRGSATTHSLPPLDRSPHLSLSPPICLSSFSVKLPLLSPPHAGPRWVIWLDYRGSTQYKYTYRYGDAYRESKTHDDPSQHVCTTPKLCTICLKDIMCIRACPCSNQTLHTACPRPVSYRA